MRMILALLAGAALYGQIPEQDARNTDIPNTDTHFIARKYPTLAEWQARREHLRKQLLSAAGLLPMLPKNDLHPQIFGKIENRAYTIEKVLIETLPGYYLGGNLYRPTKAAPAGGFPAIVSPHGHWPYGRLEHSATASVPARCINLAQQGYVVFAYDMVGYNDTIQTPHDFGSPREQLWDFGPYSLQLWNSIRAVDFVQGLPGVNPARIGATGASGGATQTFSLAAVDDRIQFSAPVNMVSAIMQGGGLCENAPNLRLDTFNVEIASIMAPRPMILVSATGDWTKNTPAEEFPAIRAIYDLYGKGDQVETLHLDAPHNYNLPNREAVYRFFGKTVLGETDAAKFKERNIQLEKLQDMLALQGRRLPEDALNYDGVVAEWIRMGRERAGQVTDRAQLREMLELALGAEWPEHVMSETRGEKVLFGRAGRGDRVAGLVRPGTGRKILLVHPEGADAARKSTEFAALAKSGRPIYAIDAFQTGAAVAPRNRDAKMFLTFNRSDDANRVQDILTVLRGLDGEVELIGLGKAAVWCEFAAALARSPVEWKGGLAGFGGTDEDYLASFFVPGIQRAGGLRAARVLTQSR
jgi:hypothetical protein